jgi:hypothetical protein
MDGSAGGGTCGTAPAARSAGRAGDPSSNPFQSGPYELRRGSLASPYPLHFARNAFMWLATAAPALPAVVCMLGVSGTEVRRWECRSRSAPAVGR